MLWRQRKADRLDLGKRGPIDERALWTELRPVRWLAEAERPGTPVLEIVSVCKAEVPGLVRDHGHAFIRLVDEEGGIRPIGFFPDESTGVEPDDFPGLRMPGMLLLPDKYDRIAWNPLITRIALSRPAFDGICTRIEQMQRGKGEGELGFDLLDQSCAGFVVRIARLARIRVEAEVRLTDFADGAGVAAGPNWRRHLGRLLPRPLYRLLFNLALSSHGGFCTVSRQWDKSGDEPVLRMIRGIQPVFTRWRDLWSRHVPFYHVRALREWQRRVEREGLEPYRLAEA
ncbi:hypothetical protein RNI52_04160 [Labrys neptuniae]|uniref:hypothetical protein n=1 Tax=Labrys neptuniae TaxID=376174 RepID=UPI00288F70EA|nr:hypothetical protein [Labrys neptuniae]MDT3376514.1 hypothetical protein [Labrys neptuniae]